MNREGNLVIIGAGQYGEIVKETAEALKKFDKIDFLDDNSSLAIGTTNELINFLDNYANAFVAIGNSKIRLEFLMKLKKTGYRLVTLIHPNAYVSNSSKIEKGCIIEPNAVIHANVSIGVGCLISAGAVINHNADVEDGCHIDCNATVTARSVVKTKTKVYSGEVYNSEAKHV